MRFAGLFAGIGGFERGLNEAGHETALLSEIHPGARRVLEVRFPDAPLVGDVCSVKDLPSDVDGIVAGFPCQDLSQAGQGKGLGGSRSGLVSEVFRLAEGNRSDWIILENVPFMLQLGRGAAMLSITSKLEELGYRWAWRVVDTLSFGLPQRRMRVFLVASRSSDPAGVLFSDNDHLDRPKSAVGEKAHGFYWTEGRTGLGWAPDAVPTLKNGSAVGIPSPPAILLPSGEIIKPDIRDAERLQGFEADWTLPAEEVAKSSSRWALVGSAVSVPVAKWLGQRLASPGEYDSTRDMPWSLSSTLPRAARFDGAKRHVVSATTDPVAITSVPLAEFLLFPGTPLSHRAASSFLARTRIAKLRFQPGFIAAVEGYVSASRPAEALAAE